MNQKLKTAIESAIRLSAGLRMKDESISSVAVSINVDAFIAALREQGVVVTWAEPAQEACGEAKQLCPTPEDAVAVADMDVEAFLNMRTWVEDALTARGAEVTDAGIGMGAADLGVKLEGFTWNLKLKPRMIQANQQE